ncbi:ATP-binding protein [Aquipseudomonas alcaligenes]|uniref:histidine kinase n=1 Tax=Aquipseudomonas alcaligenes TaxID=43263 RepID=A0AA37CEY6_AQUAC|nr:ATP-binding protein [Pseudomonas alcaligenes]BCR25192.1 two-component sensor histidine kinase [Pseudomonas alcaligenes]GIZ67068.1 two-component sensor histidine kinase [Pseudomonas alcaligenes]GIZ71671.1 two-component sensor histidine kinase [Pseudomonas alcaligenes]GIZ76020.1 two-component sensor histidine kinase [Pseudomonas alcaligenes]GIZ79880.1 two-component sensor histidine kinase [Pseudomonas alcaligenes]
MTSMRRRTLALVLGLMLLGTLAMTLFNYFDSTHEVEEIYDAQLAHSARLLQGLMRTPVREEERAGLYRAFNEALAQAGQRSKPGHPYESKLAFQVWDASGHLLVHSAGAPSLESPSQQEGFAALELGPHKWRGFLLRDSSTGLLIWTGERDDVRRELVTSIVRHTLFPTLLGSLLLAALLWWAIGWGLAPLRNMAAVIRARHADSLQPLQLEPLPSELAPMQAALNRLLGQIEQLLERERRFIADAAHELRTPLAVLRVHVQNATQARDEAERQQSLGYLLGGIDRATRVVNQLLTLARMEPLIERGEMAQVDVLALVRETLAELTPWVLKQGLELDLEAGEGDYHLNADPGSLGIALQNLVTNAVNHSPAGGRLHVRLSADAQRLLLQVEDQGPGIPAEDLERVFERFYSRGTVQGAGLGLAIVQSIARRHAGQIRLRNLDSGGLQASLELPRSA